MIMVVLEDGEILFVSGEKFHEVGYEDNIRDGTARAFILGMNGFYERKIDDSGAFYWEKVNETA